MLIKEGSDVNQLIHPESKQIYDEFKKAQKALQTVEEKDIGYKSDDSYFNGAQGGYQQQYNQYQGGIFGNQNLFGQGNLFGNQIYQQNLNNVQQVKEPQTMFKLAVDSGQLGLSYLILDNGFDLMQAMEDSLKKQKFQFVLTLLQKVSDNKLIQKTNEKQQNLFHIFAQNAASLNSILPNKILERIYKQFKRRDLDINSVDILGRTPLHYAAISGSYSLVKLFTQESEININHKDCNSITPLIASLKGERIKKRENFEVFKILSKASIDCNQVYYDPIYKDLVCQKKQNDDDMMIDTSTPKYKVTLFNHLIRQYDQIERTLRTELLNFMFSETCKWSIYDKDENGKSFLMIMVEQNHKHNLEEVLNAWENSQKLLKQPFAVQDDVDFEGRNVINSLVTMSKIGMYDNVQLLEFLIEKGFSFSMQDKYHKRPIDYAASFKNSDIFKRLSKLGQTARDSLEIDKSAFTDEQNDVEMIYTEQEIQYLQDAEEFLKLNKDVLLQQEKVTEIQPDPILREQIKTLSVVYSEPGNQETAYNAYLIKIDIKKYGHSPYVFYKLQLNHDSQKNIYILLTRWGMIGEQGMCQKTPFNKLDDAVAEFRKIFKAKTSNDWDERKNFQIPKAKNKYILYEQYRNDYSYTDLIKPFKWSECKISQLQDDQQNFMKLISNIAIYNEALKLQDVQKSKINMTNIPKEKLEEALTILKELEQILNSQGLLNNYRYISDKDELENQNKKIVSLSIKIYQLIPMLKEGQEAPRPIDRNSVAAFKNKIYDLLTLEKASKIFLGANFKKQEISPLDYIYKVLNIKVESLSKESDDYSLVTQYMKNTSKTVLSNQVFNSIYKISRQEDESKFKEMNFHKDPHKLLLFHGTSLQNILGILNCGFKVSPMGISQCGAAFGQGVYFSNFLEKSFHYARPTTAAQLHLDEEEMQIITDEAVLKTRRYILVCEIAMGKIVKYEQQRQQYNYNRYGGYNSYYGGFGGGGMTQNYYGIGTQKQLKEIFDDLIKAEEDQKIQQIAPQLSDYEDQDSDSDYLNDDEDDQVMKEEENLNNLSLLSQTQSVKKAPEAVYKDQIQELPNGKVIYGKKVDITRTLRGHKMMHIKAQQKINRFDTFWVGGTQIPDPQFNVTLKDGSIVPTGKSVQVVERSSTKQQSVLVNQGSLFNNLSAQTAVQQDVQTIQIQGAEFSEFVVKNPDRIKIRYLVELREMTEAERLEQTLAQRIIQNDD